MGNGLTDNKLKTMFLSLSCVIQYTWLQNTGETLELQVVFIHLTYFFEEACLCFFIVVYKLF